MLFLPKYSLIVFALSFLVACTSEKKKTFETDGGLKYKFHDIVVDGDSPQPGDYLSVYISWSTPDSVYYNSTKTKEPVNLIVLGQTKSGGLEEGLSIMKVGDSASFFLDPGLFYKEYLNQPLPQSLEGKKELEVTVRLLKVQSTKSYFADLETSKERLELEEISMVKKRVEEWKMEYDSVFEFKGCYMVFLSPFVKDSVKKGDEVNIHYSASFFNGEEYYSTSFNGKPETYLVGSKDQTVDGLQIAFLHMSFGQRAKIIVPSYMGFGEKGSAGGIVPPFTPIIYEIEVLENH